MIRKAQERGLQLLFLMFLIIIVARNPANSRALDGRSNPDNPPKRWQLKFSVGADFIPRQFDGIKIYLQRRISANGALRFGVGLRGLDRDSMSKNRIIDRPDDYNEEIDSDDDQSVLGLDLTYVGYIKSTTAIRPYIGIGPFYDRTVFGYERDYRSFGDRSGQIRVIYDHDFLDTGLCTVMGVEWRLNGVLILQMEYKLMFHYIHYRTDSYYKRLSPAPEYVSENTYYHDYFRINAASIKTGVSVVF